MHEFIHAWKNNGSIDHLSEKPPGASNIIYNFNLLDWANVTYRMVRLSKN